MVTARLSRWTRVLLVASMTVFVLGAALLTYRYVTNPITLNVAVGSFNGEAARLMTTVASRLASTNAHIRLKIIDTGSPLAASEVFASGNTDLAILRADAGDLSSAQTVLLLGHAVAMLIAPPGSTIKSIDELKDMTVGIVGEEINKGLVQSLSKICDLDRAKVRFRAISVSEVPQGGSLEAGECDPRSDPINGTVRGNGSKLFRAQHEAQASADPDRIGRGNCQISARLWKF